jgi:hypothetical protein
MNTASLSRISTTINGIAELVPSGSEEENWYKTQHLANNTFGSITADDYSNSPVEAGLWAGGGLGNSTLSSVEDYVESDGGTKCYVEGGQVRVVVVRVTDGRIADWRGQVRDWTVSPNEDIRTVNGTLED